MRYVIFLSILISECVFSDELNREICRDANDDEIIIQCIEGNIWDPCSEGASGSSYWGAQCGWVHSKIIYRKIQSIQKKTIEALNLLPEKKYLIEVFKNSEVAWQSYRDKYCNVTNEFAKEGGDESLSVAYCVKRLNNQHLDELEKTTNELIYTANIVNKNREKEALEEQFNE